jgi:ABC-2 type transport system permease protein
MNIYSFELKRSWKGFLLSAVVVVALYVVFMGGMYSVFSQSRATIEGVLANYPPQFAEAFGIADTSTGGAGIGIFGYGGFFGFVYLYLALAVSIMATSWSLNIFGREKISQCTEFLVSKPTSRTFDFCAKLLVVLTQVVAMGIIVQLTIVLGYAMQSDRTVPLGRLVVAGLALTGVQFVFIGIGALWAVLNSRIRSVSGLATAAGIVGFILAALPQITGEDAWRVIAPFRYFDVSGWLAGNPLSASEGGYCALAICLPIVLLVSAWAYFVHTDVKVR